jgi:hypothetical protein
VALWSSCDPWAAARGPGGAQPSSPRGTDTRQGNAHACGGEHIRRSADLKRAPSNFSKSGRDGRRGAAAQHTHYGAVHRDAGQPRAMRVSAARGVQRAQQGAALALFPIFSNRPVVKRGKIMFSYRSGIPAIFTTRVDQTNGSTLVKVILFEKSRGIWNSFFNLLRRVGKPPKANSRQFSSQKYLTIQNCPADWVTEGCHRRGMQRMAGAGRQRRAGSRRRRRPSSLPRTSSLPASTAEGAGVAHAQPYAAACAHPSAVHASLTRAGCVVTGFDNPGKSLYTSIRELVENSLDAAEAIGVLPEVRHRLRARRARGFATRPC